MKINNHPLFFALGLQMLIISDIATAETDSLRLFHEHPDASETVRQSEQLHNKPKTHNKGSILADDTSETPASYAAAILYHYHGFISGDSGEYYFINGYPVRQLKLIELLSVSDAGRTLLLMTSGGYRFTLSIGESRLIDPGSNLSQSVQ